jgi:hypothetical protein
MAQDRHRRAETVELTVRLSRSTHRKGMAAASLYDLTVEEFVEAATLCAVTQDAVNDDLLAEMCRRIESSE